MNLDEQGSMEALKNQLSSAGISTDTWGTGKSKSLKDLKKEIEEGKSTLIISGNGEILRKVKVAKIDLFFNGPKGKRFKLIEEKRLYSDGREKSRDTAHSVSKKIRKNQTPESAIKGAIQKKLGISGNINLTEIDMEEDTNLSPSYPDLRSVYIFYNFQADLSEDQYNPEGYTERHKENVTIYTWKEL
jgi:hypothetical protein